MSAAPPNADLRFDEGDCIIRFSDDEKDWVLIHSDVLRTSCPLLGPLLKAEWNAPRVVSHPTSGAEVKVYELNLRFVDQTFVVGHTADAIAAHPSTAHQYHRASPFDQSELAPEGWPEHASYGRFWDYSEMFTVAHTAHKIILTILYDMPVSLEDLGGQLRRKGSHTSDPEFMDAVMDRIATLCAYAEFYGCLSKVAEVVVEWLKEHRCFWQSVAENPIKYLQIGEKLRSKSIYFDALRHLVANPQWSFGTIADCLGVPEAEARSRYGVRRYELATTVGKMERDLMKLQLTESWATFSGNYWTVATTFFNAIRYKDKNRPQAELSNERADLLARTIWGQWLAQQIAGEFVYIFTKQRSERAGPLTAALRKLETVAASGDPTSLFGQNIPGRITSIFQLGRMFNPRKQVHDALVRIVKEAGEITAKAFPVQVKVEDEIELTYRRAECDIHGEYFAYVALDEGDVPWAGSYSWSTPAMPAVDTKPISEAYARTLGLQ